MTMLIAPAGKVPTNEGFLTPVSWRLRLVDLGMVVRAVNVIVVPELDFVPAQFVR